MIALVPALERIIDCGGNAANLRRKCVSKKRFRRDQHTAMATRVGAVFDSTAPARRHSHSCRLTTRSVKSKVAKTGPTSWSSPFPSVEYIYKQYIKRQEVIGSADSLGVECTAGSRRAASLITARATTIPTGIIPIEVLEKKAKSSQNAQTGRWQSA